MARQRSSRPVSRAPAPQQSRPATTYAARPAPPPSAPVAAPAPQMAAPVSQGPGLFGQMASTAAGVAIGSSVGHAIGNMFGGGSSEAAPQQQAAPPPQQYATSSTAQQENWGPNCSTATRSFTQCMDEQSGNMQICGWYLEQLKACQAAASHY
ncbi:chch domain containing protein [Grosmannia clavigera kw1407]|uniref:Chch domain containing protein n=1 Tax=Grosmannia clavigera (strain kw1407 / UAMH 11150) TaxID=655863 RepID=F0XUN8_GROCL|nr:chch domain containing protein [Grosmannia clavigera kw1407]EFW98688.1 chch domain containing protein [Grosmannia clavigera kw1407]